MWEGDKGKEIKFNNYTFNINIKNALKFLRSITWFTYMEKDNYWELIKCNDVTPDSLALE
jgi:hypothetical protein